MRSAPERTSYDVVIIGGAMIGSSVAWFLTDNPDFTGSVLVVERDASYSACSTAHTNSCMRQQFTNKINVQISQFAADFVKNFRAYMHDDPDVPHVILQSYGYMYLADTPEMAETLQAAQKMQAANGAGTQHLSCDDIAAAYPFYALDDILAANHNLKDEGYFDGATLFDWWKRKARANGAEYIENEVTGITRTAGKVQSVTLASGDVVACGAVVNATGPRAARTARMAGLDLPVEPRKRFTFIFDAARPLDRDLPLTIDPSGVHMRTDGAYYLAGCPPDLDPPVAFEDFDMHHDLWEHKVWPAIAARIPQFEAIKLINSWAGHYAFNTLDQNAVLGPAPGLPNFFFANGFSGHGFQQSPAVGRGLAELLIYGAYKSLDLTPFGYDRILSKTPFKEAAVI